MLVAEAENIHGRRSVEMTSLPMVKLTSLQVCGKMNSKMHTKMHTTNYYERQVIKVSMIEHSDSTYF